MAFTYGTDNFTFKTMLAGSFFGEIELIDHTAREFTAITEMDSEFFVLSNTLFEQALSQYPSIAH